MNCEKTAELINEKLDGCISPENEKLLTDHLDTCESCRALYEALAGLDDAIKDCQMEPPAALHEGVMQSIHREKSGRTSRKTWGAVASVAAVAAVFAILAGVGLVQMPGMQNGQKANTVSMSDAVGLVLPQDLPSTEGPEARYAAETATENKCIVAVFRNCELLSELENSEYRVLEDGAKVYEVSAQTLDTLLQTYQKAYPIGTYYPEGACREDAAIVMLLK